MPHQPMPPGVAGQSWLVRVSTTRARTDPASCPTHVRTAVRPLLVPDPPLPFRSSPLQEFGLGPLFDSLDLMEHRGWPIERVISELRRTHGVFGGRGPIAHPALLTWTAETLERFTSARAAEQVTARDAGLPFTEPVGAEWSVRTARQPEADARGARQYEHTVWGRRYASADGSVRDLWLPSLGRAKPDRSDAEKAAIAHVLALGEPGARPRWGDAPPEHATRLVRTPDRVRVFDFGCADGGTQLLLDWNQEDVERQFAEHAAPAFHESATGTAVRPGSSCVDCKALNACTDLHRAPGLWGGSPSVPTRKRRTVSAWDLRLHAECPAEYHLTRHLHLNSLQEEGEGASRGRAVDAWLNERHRSDARNPRGCRNLPGPADPGLWSAGEHRLEGDLARQGAAMLREHRALCPLDGLGRDERVLVQERVTAYIPELDVVVIADPDLLHTRSGGWIWRETKTSTSRLWERESLMQRYPQLALGVLLLAAGAMGADARRSWVEFELLNEDDSTLERLDCGRAEVVDEARDIVAGLAQPLLDDTTYEPRTGRHCHSCRARPWCAPGSTYGSECDSTPAPPPEGGAPRV
ncbi:PD-(D/E)XK nuclease family protein [Streptomyces sp. NPDC005318]|uniref:PD-(D/E)XK nuclease family protein n=1 Tax=Streptomyces sp. NPDC005318 TaxID=3157031 RepID=UPI0033AC2A63